MPKIFAFDRKLGRVVELSAEQINARAPSKCREGRSSGFGPGRKKRGTHRVIHTIYDKKLKKHVEISEAEWRRLTPREKSEWPIVSNAMAVSPEDIGKAKRILKQHGVRTEYTKTGEPILRDQTHRKQHCRALGFYDRNCYGGTHDASPINR